jgi:energy-coupling factor transporter ATP-binding protein EcfA2
MCEEARNVAVEQRQAREGEMQTMKHIDEFTIHAFRGLRDVKLEGLGQINLLVGENNSGKTSVLEALAIFCNPFDRLRWRNVLSMREMSNPRSSLGSRERFREQLLWLFPQEKEGSDGSLSTTNILLSATGSFPVEEVSASYEEFSEIVQLPVYRMLAEGEVGFEEQEVKDLRIQVSSSSRQAKPRTSKAVLEFANRAAVLPKQKTPVLPVQIVNSSSHHYDLDNAFSQRWSEVTNAEAQSDALALLQFFDKDIEDIDIITKAKEPIVSVKHKKLGRAPLSIFGDGLRHVFTLAGAVVAVKGGLLLVDELETAIHTDVLDKTFGWLVKACIRNDVQLFATTHNLEALDVVMDACREATDLVAYRLSKRKEQTTVKRFDKEKLIQLREDLGLEVR